MDKIINALALAFLELPQTQLNYVYLPVLHLNHFLKAVYVKNNALLDTRTFRKKNATQVAH